jgi:spermidine/putrescine transport system substrate-binding protein
VEEFAVEHAALSAGELDRSLGRRQFLKLAMALSAAGLSGGALAACGGAGSGTPAADVDPDKISGTLRLLAWEGYEGKGIIDAWRSSKALKVDVTPMSDNEQIVSQLRAGGLGRYDLASPNASYIPLLHAAKVVQPIDVDKIPNAWSTIPEIAKTAAQNTIIDGQQYAVPYLWGQDGIIYNAKRIAKPESWMDVMKPEFKGRVVMVGGVNPIFEIWPRVLGYDLQNLSRAQLDKVVAFMVKLIKTQVRVTTSDPFQALSVLARGEADLIASGVAIGFAALAPKGDKLLGTIPKDGGATWIDTWAVPEKAPNLDSAYGFVNHMLSPDVQAKVASALTEGTVSKNAIDRVSKTNAEIYNYRDSSAIGTDLAPLFRFPLDSSPSRTNYTDWTNAWRQIQSQSA